MTSDYIVLPVGEGVKGLPAVVKVVGIEPVLSGEIIVTCVTAQGIYLLIRENEYDILDLSNLSHYAAYHRFITA